MSQNLDTSQIKEWRSIVTLIVFLLTNIVVLFPFSVPVYIPQVLYNAASDTMSACRLISPMRNRSPGSIKNSRSTSFVRLNFPMNFATAPLIADLFLLAISAIGRQEVHDGTVGANNISPIDIMIFFLTLAYIAISIDASGLIRYLAFRVLQKGGKVGHLLFFYLYALFFSLGTFIGNDPIILSGTAFLAYMTRVSSNIRHPRAWIHSQFAVANIASAILVSSNPTNLVLAGAFEIKFLVYTANMIVPVVVTAIVLFPFLLYIVFANEELIPLSIKMHELSEEERAKPRVNPNIPHAKGRNEEEETDQPNEEGKLLSLVEIMNPFLDKGGAAFGAIIMAVTLITLLAINAASQSSGEHPVFWVTLPAAFVMFCWDIAFGWKHRKDTRQIARDRRHDYERAQAERIVQKEEADREKEAIRESAMDIAQPPLLGHIEPPTPEINTSEQYGERSTVPITDLKLSRSELSSIDDKLQNFRSSKTEVIGPLNTPSTTSELMSSEARDEEKCTAREQMHKAGSGQETRPTTLVSLVKDAYLWAQETFPTCVAVVAHLPFKLVPFALSMFVLIQGLVTKGWVPVFAHGWDHWVTKTGTVGAIGGMGFLSVILCNFAGTNIGTTILLSRIIQAWQDIHQSNNTAIADRTFWATVYSMALGVNYGAFSTAFSASLAGLLWRDILARKHIRVSRLEFARLNVPIIATAMAVGCAVLIGEVYIMRDNSPYSMK
ncbi:arsenite efflux transporter-like protein ArsB-like protein [Delphinella strobiligena]|nr:arsenite efflux transporter-like protein ArsB-like protein [Delphinella strobiligena]